MGGLLNAALYASDIERFWSKVDRAAADQCWLWKAGVCKDGYGKFAIGKSRQQRHFKAHRLAHFFTTGVYAKVVMHTCDNPPCCNPYHLIGATQTDNRADCVAKGRHARGKTHSSKTKPEIIRRGERHYKARINESLARQILDSVAAGIPRIEVARQLKISPNIVYQIACGRTWRHIDRVVQPC